MASETISERADGERGSESDVGIEQLLAERPDGAVGGDPGGAQAEPSKTALIHDAWSMRKGRSVYRESKVVAAAFPRDKRVSLCDDPDVLAKESRLEELTADFFAAAYDPDPIVAEACENERLHRYVRNLLETPEFQQLRSRTVLQEESAELAASSIVGQWFTMVESKEEPEKEIDKDIQSLLAASKAARDAMSGVQEMNDVSSALGIGAADGANPGTETDDIRRRFAEVRKNPMLRRIFELAGRYRRVAQSVQRQKVNHGMDDVMGIEMGSDVAKLIPSELAMLADEDGLEVDVIRRLFESSAMVRSYRGVEKVGRGPIVVFIDESGSMNGEPLCDAKAIALAFAWIARHQKRWCCLVGFASNRQGNYLTIPPGAPKTDRLIAWLSHFFKGGTSLDIPLLDAPSRWAQLGVPDGATDFVLVTDGLVNLPGATRDSFLKFKKERKVKLNSILIGDAPGSLPLVSDRLWMTSELGVDAKGVAETMGSV